MYQPHSIWCHHCGTTFPIADRSAAAEDAEFISATCPVCGSPISVDTPPSQRQMTVSDLEGQLSALINCARAAGVDDVAIVHALSSELEFAAEMHHLGHQFTVQLVDLGLHQLDLQYRPTQDRREILQTRSVNGG